MDNSWIVDGPTKSFTYILPMLGDKLFLFYHNQYFPQRQFRNCFIGDEERQDLTDKIFLLYQFNGKIEYDEFIRGLEKHSQFVELYRADDFHDMLVFNVPEEVKESYSLFKQSKYSKFQNFYKKHIIAFHEAKPGHPIVHTLNNTEAGFKYWEHKYSIQIPRNQECGEAINPMIEIYRKEYRVYNLNKIRPNEQFNQS